MAYSMHVCSVLKHHLLSNGLYPRAGKAAVDTMSQRRLCYNPQILTDTDNQEFHTHMCICGFQQLHSIWLLESLAVFSSVLRCKPLMCLWIGINLLYWYHQIEVVIPQDDSAMEIIQNET